ncbi:hypothetical protein Slin15195_G017710 [Septoria linicola]|uniref:Uncharacterized protein n=1 Tax=Septoria linicola TaxID=215465 RepID=A0A9Q9EG72_9PEZI|nr:hypothetical protein Slin15195_G017710 [Septoria linicola]
MARGNAVPITADLPFRRQIAGWGHANNQDFIIGMMRSELDGFNLRNLKSTDKCLMMKAASGATNVYDLRGTHIGYSKYSFEPWAAEAVCMDVHVDNQCRIWVLGEKTWTPFVNWLGQSVESEVNVWSTTHLVGQAVAPWRANNKKFKLLELPAEVREAIYNHTFGESGRYSYRYARLGKADRWSDTTVATQQPEVTIFQLNRQVYLEASHTLFEHTVFRVTCLPDLHRMLIKNSVLASRIRRLELALDVGDLYELFRMPDTARPRAFDSVQLCQRMKLKELMLEVGAPEKSESDLINGTIIWIVDRPIICHRKFLDIVLRAALPRVLGNAVTITGYAKTIQKHEFVAKCIAKRKEYLEWCKNMPLGYDAWTIADYEEWKTEEDGGVRVDSCQALTLDKVAEDDEVLTSQEEMNCSEGDEFPPRCSCDVRCALETWDAEV